MSAKEAAHTLPGFPACLWSLVFPEGWSPADATCLANPRQKGRGGSFFPWDLDPGQPRRGLWSGSAGLPWSGGHAHLVSAGSPGVMPFQLLGSVKAED